MENKTMKLSDGRKLGYAEYGDPDGSPVIYFHGTPSSRIHPVTAALDKMVQSPSVPSIRIIAVERPGYGLSDPMPERTLHDWTQDIIEFSDFLGVDRFGLLAVSGGGPFAVACSHALPNRITKTAIIAGLGPLEVPDLIKDHSQEDQDSFHAAIHSPQTLVDYTKDVHADPEGVVNNILKTLPESDRQKIPQEMAEVYKQTVFESSRHPDGLINDYKIFLSPWQIPLDQIEIPVRFWHSDADQSVPISHAEYLQKLIPKAELTTLHGYSHFSVMFPPLQEVIAFLTNDQADQSS